MNKANNVVQGFWIAVAAAEITKDLIAMRVRHHQAIRGSSHQPDDFYRRGARGGVGDIIACAGTHPHLQSWNVSRVKIIHVVVCKSLRSSEPPQWIIVRIHNASEAHLLEVAQTIRP